MTPPITPTEALKNDVVIVTGLPRTGTSMMMRMLEAGGMPVLIDNLREQDDDNPRGYYEYEPVKKTKQDPSWLDQAGGKVVKMVYRLLYDLPLDRSYRVVWMQRNLEEVIASQNIMLDRNNKQLNEEDDARTIKLFEHELAQFDRWIESQERFEVLRVNHRDLVTGPQESVAAINGFLRSCLDEQSMTAIVEPSLYRNRR